MGFAEQAAAAIRFFDAFMVEFDRLLAKGPIEGSPLHPDQLASEERAKAEKAEAKGEASAPVG